MFDPIDHPRVFGVNLGTDFPKAIADGILHHFKDRPPEDLARVTLYVNTRRMARRLGNLFASDDVRLLPQIKLVTDIALSPALADGRPSVDPLARRLQLTQLVRKLIEAQPGLAPPSSAFDLADSLASLMDEMQGEGVDASVLATLKVDDHSEYWARSLKFIDLVQKLVADNSAVDSEARQRLSVTRLIDSWQANPPSDPIIIAGSTGSRATTRLFMEAVAKLPQGAVILPGFDFELPAAVWEQLGERKTSEDHPQYRFKRMMDGLDLSPSLIVPWAALDATHAPRNALISLALRPAPVTDAWLKEGRNLNNLVEACAPITFVEAPAPRIEALAIATGMRKAISDGKSVALITPDRVLTRQVTAALLRWNITPNDSAGLPLALSAPGRLLRQTAEALGARMTSEDLLALLKHPLVASSDVDRGAHLSNTRMLELDCLRGGPPFPDRINLEAWLARRTDQVPDLTAWLGWLCDLLDTFSNAPTASLGDTLELHRTLTERLSAGTSASENFSLWDREAGIAALAEMEKLRAAAPSGGVVTPQEYRDLVGAVLAKGEVRSVAGPDQRAMIWGTLESRVQGADLIIMAGLNDGVWPETPNPDPWLNRAMRQEAGLLLPEQMVGLSAHDFQQSITAPEVWMTRSLRDAETETVPSRWINRLRNLLDGLPNGGKQAFSEMKARGDEVLALVTELERPKTVIRAAPRPAPQPPLAARPTKLSVTRVEKLIRDPYAIYARYILNLSPLRDLATSADAPMRGQAIHDVLDRFIRETSVSLGPDPQRHLMQIAREVFQEQVPWPAVRQMWQAKLARAAPWFIDTERDRRAAGQPMSVQGNLMIEETVHAEIKDPLFRLEGRIDRVDQLNDGRLVIYDYKTGSLPSPKQEKHFNKQLPLLAAMIYQNGIAGETGFQVAQTSYLGLGSSPRESAKAVSDAELEKVWEDFTALVAEYADADKGYAARRAVFETRFAQDYDHLSRFGEWSSTDEPVTQRVGS